MSPDEVNAALRPDSGAGIDATSFASPIFKASPKYKLTPPSSSVFVPLTYRMDEDEGPMKRNSEMDSSPSQSLMAPVFKSSLAHLVEEVWFSKEYLETVKRANS